MAWSTPRTWVSGETLTAALLNTHVRDQFRAIGDPWTTYTPAWTASGTNPTLGNGTIEGSYAKMGQLVIFRLRITFGSTTNVGAGTWRFGLPASAILTDYPAGQGLVFDSSAGDRRFCGALITAPTEITLRTTNDNAVVTSSAPFVWATGDTISVSGTYES